MKHHNGTIRCLFSKIYTRGLLGLHAPLIEVEVHVSQGLPSLTIVGLAEAAVRESKDRGSLSYY